MKFKTVGIVLLALALGLGSGYLVRHWTAEPYRPAVTQGDHDAMYRAQGADVVLYSLSTCPFCAKARTLLTDHGVAFVERTIDQSDDAKAEAMALGIDSVPVLFVGSHRIQGYSEDTILRLLREDGAIPDVPGFPAGATSRSRP